MSDDRITRWYTAQHPYTQRGIRWLLRTLKRCDEWRNTCNRCGERLHNIVPYGRVCLNTDCRHCRLGKRNG